MSYWGPVAGHGLLSHDLEMIKAERKLMMPEKAGNIGGDVEAVSTGEIGDVYVQIRKRRKAEEEEQKQEEQNPESD